MAEPRMWPASRYVAHTPGATSRSSSYSIGSEVLERALGVLHRVERLVEVDVDGRRLGSQLGFGIARPEVGAVVTDGLDRGRDVLAGRVGVRRRGHGTRVRARVMGRLDGGLLGAARGGEIDGGLVLGRLLRVVGGDLIGMALLPARLALGELLVQVSRVEEHERGQLDRAVRRVDLPAVALANEDRQQAAVVQVGMGQSTASSVPGSKANGIRLRTDSLGLPWNMPQSMSTRARSVVKRNWDPVTVVAPPRNWRCMPAW